VAGLDAGDPVGERLEEVEPLGLRVGARHREDVEALEERDLLFAVEGALVAELRAEPDSRIRAVTSAR